MSVVTPIFFFFVLTCIFHSSDASTILVDGASLWENPPGGYMRDSVALPPQESAMSPDISPTEAPAPFSGADPSPSRTFPWPFQAESPEPSTGKGGTGMPLINSNPAAPLPKGEVDSATIRPTPTSADQRAVMVEILPFHVALHSMAFFLPFLL
ncbi:leucine-rich repeat extensin-like protein 5 [Neltuma alba]|uniref:leucine-rich repeat extensin-like protein 5 n=1 Tax=Neltuma alba TaxID=207710 RepID=UPI0010A3149E|nr:leucine-rich repeat extensin-like protein 5 [Prosopis alba]